MGTRNSVLVTRLLLQCWVFPDHTLKRPRSRSGFLCGEDGSSLTQRAHTPRFTSLRVGTFPNTFIFHLSWLCQLVCDFVKVLPGTYFPNR